MRIHWLGVAIVLGAMAYFARGGGWFVALLLLPLLAWYAIPFEVWRRRKSTPLLKSLGPVRYGVTAFLTMTMAGVVVKIILRLALNVKYVLATPFFNI